MENKSDKINIRIGKVFSRYVFETITVCKDDTEKKKHYNKIPLYSKKTHKKLVIYVKNEASFVKI